MIQMIVWSILGFLFGSIPFSFLIVKGRSGRDIREIGDGNPGAANAFKAGGWGTGLPALLFDYLKAALPVSLAHYAFGIEGWFLVPVAVAPVLGHAFSPFFRGRGGKAVAATFGMWTGLTIAEGPIVLGLIYVVLILAIDSDAWSTVIGATGLLVYMILSGHSAPILVTGLLSLIVLIAKQGRLLLISPKLRTRRSMLAE